MSNLPNPTPRSLADQFRNWSDEQLARLLQQRPDLGVPPPTDSSRLASRAVDRRSTLIALDRLDSFQLLVLQSLCQETELPAPAAQVAAAVEHLVGLGLAWGDPVRTTSTVRDLLTAPEGPAQVDLSTLSPTQLALLHSLDHQYADGSLGATRGPAAELIRLGLLARIDENQVRLTWSTRLALRASSGRPLAEPPPVATSTREPLLIDRMAAGAGFELCRRVEFILDRWSSSPPPALRGGGLGSRELKALAESLHIDIREAGLILETAFAAGLIAIGITEDLDQAWLPTELYDEWLRSDTPQRWLQLAQGWLASDQLIGLIGTRAEGKPVNALSPELRRSWVADLRLAVLTQLPRELGVTLAATTGPLSLRDRVQWQHPRRPLARLEHLPQLLHEASVIGVIGLDGLSTLGVALLAEHSGQTGPELHEIFPAPIEQVLLQADLTAVAPGPLTTEVARRLGGLAEVESRGGATVYRFSVDSVLRAFDQGWSASDIHSFLERVSSTEVPQPLSYLVDDVARRFGILRVGMAECFLRSDDPQVLSELLHNPAAAGLGLRRIAPTVVITQQPLDILLNRIRELGLAPVVEAADGTLQVLRPEIWRARSANIVAPARVARQIAHTQALVTAIRAGDQVAAGRHQQTAAAGPADIIAMLRNAVETKQELTINYVGNDGTTGERIVAPIRVEDGQLLALDRRTGTRRSFSIHRISRLGSL